MESLSASDVHHAFVGRPFQVVDSECQQSDVRFHRAQDWRVQSDAALDSAACSTMQHFFAAAHYRVGRGPAVEPIRWDPSSPIHRSKAVRKNDPLEVEPLGRREQGPPPLLEREHL